TDPDHLHDMYLSTILLVVANGRLREAQRLARVNDELCARLTPHHRLHAVAVLGEVADAAGDWEALRDLRPRTGEAAIENAFAPCVRNARALLVAAVAHERLGEADEARRLEAAAEELGMAGWEKALA